MKFTSMRFVLILLFSSFGSAADVEQVVDYDGHIITGHLRDSARSPFTITVRTEPYTKKRDDAVKTWIGNESNFPREVITEISLSIGGIKIAIPRVAFVDLGDPHVPHNVYLMQFHEFVYLYIVGSDGAGGYKARFTFKDNKLIERQVEALDYEDPKPAPEIKKFE